MRIDICRENILKTACVVALYLGLNFSAVAKVDVSPAPAEEPKFGGCTLKIDGKPADVYACRVSKFPINQWWPGYQRDLDQTEAAGFAYWNTDGVSEVEIISKNPVKSVEVRPLSLGIKPKIDGEKISFKLDKIRPVVVEINGYHNALHLFPNSAEKAVPAPKSKICCRQCNYCSPVLHSIPVEKSPKSYYFAAGRHDVGTLFLESGDSVYIAAGAVVYGSLVADNADNIKISGRGILDGSHILRADKLMRGGFGCLHFRNCTNLSIKGIVLRDPNSWCVNVRRCKNVDISNLKMIGLWRYNSDGIDIWDSANVSLKNCFIRSYDDAVIVRASGPNNTDIAVADCTILNDWGLSVGISVRGKLKGAENVSFQNIDVIRPSTCAISLKNYAAAFARNIKCKNINVEYRDWMPKQQLQKKRGELYSVNPSDDFMPRLIDIIVDSPQGTMDGVSFENINVFGSKMPPSHFRGKNLDSPISNVSMKNIQLNGKALSDLKSANMRVGKGVEKFKIEK